VGLGHHHTTTIEEGDNIATITFFVTKPQKAHATILCSKAIKKDDKSCRLFLLCYNGTIEEDRGSLSSPSFM